jgi:hypothetical protein
MKVLLDECVPRKLRRELASHEVRTVTESGWSGLKNGELLTLAEAEFDVFLTVDQNLMFQQNLQRFNIGVVLMVARNNRFKTLLPLMSEVNAAIDTVEAGELVSIGGG